MSHSDNSPHQSDGHVQCPIGTPALRQCEHCQRTLPNSTTVCPCQGGAVDEPRVPTPPATDTLRNRIGMPVTRKCEHCGRTLSSSLVVCPCRSRAGIRPTASSGNC